MTLPNEFNLEVLTQTEWRDVNSETHVRAPYHSTAGYQANTVKVLMFVYFFICVDVLLIVVCKTVFFVMFACSFHGVPYQKNKTYGHQYFGSVDCLMTSE